MTVLFLHGAGGFEEDRAIATGLGQALGVEVDYPRLPDVDMTFDAWGRAIEPRLEAVGDGVVVAHSFGASALLPLLAAGVGTPRRAILLAMPDWGPDGWDVAEYAWNGSEPAVPLSIHQCRDDEVASFDHLGLHRAAFPSATFHEHDTGGHQLDGLVDRIAADVRAS